MNPNLVENPFRRISNSDLIALHRNSSIELEKVVGDQGQLLEQTRWIAEIEAEIYKRMRLE